MDEPLLHRLAVALGVGLIIHAVRLLELVEANEPENQVRLRRALTMLKQVLEAGGDAERLRAVETRLAALSL